MTRKEIDAFQVIRYRKMADDCRDQKFFTLADTYDKFAESYIRKIQSKPCVKTYRVKKYRSVCK